MRPEGGVKESGHHLEFRANRSEDTKDENGIARDHALYEVRSEWEKALKKSR